MDTTIPSYNIYRGQASENDGAWTEGPTMYKQQRDARGGQRPRMHGEQWLYADPELWTEKWVDVLRPLLSLSVRNDLMQANPTLEAWRCVNFTLDGRTMVLVGRMTQNHEFKQYDHRAAYFTHARIVDRIVELPGERKIGSQILFQPGSSIGHSEDFDQPWLDNGKRGPSHMKPVPAVPTEWVAKHKDKSDTLKMDAKHVAERKEIAMLLSAVLQALHTETPIIINPDNVRSLTTGSEFYKVLSFIQSALPGTLRRKANVFTAVDEPKYAYGYGANIIVPSEPSPAQLEALATTMRRSGKTEKPLLVDEHGKRLRGEYDEQNAKYFDQFAAELVDLAIRKPEWLLSFTELLDGKRWPDPKTMHYLYDAAYVEGLNNPEVTASFMKYLDGIKSQDSKGGREMLNEILAKVRPDKPRLEVAMEAQNGDHRPLR